LLTHIRIDHICLAHGYLLRREQPPAGAHCKAPLMLHNILIKFPFYDDTFRLYHIQVTLEDVLSGDNSNMTAHLE
jgi:hypothetical protein